PNAVVSRAGVKGIKRKLSDEEVLGESVIVHSPADADDCFAIATRVPCDCGARAKVVPVVRIELLGQVDCAGCGIQQAEAVLVFSNDAEIVPAQAVVEREAVGEAEIVLQVERVVVLKSLAGRIALCLAATVRRTGDERVQAVKGQFAAISAVKEAVNKRTAEFIAELPVVASARPGEIIQELPVRISASTGDGCVGAKNGKGVHGDLRQPEVLGSGTHVEANRRRIKGAVLRPEGLMEAVIAEADFREQARVEHVCVRERKNVDPRGRDGVEAGKDSAADQRQREALITVAEIVTAGEVVFVTEALVDLGNQAVHAIAGGIRGQQVVAV